VIYICIGQLNCARCSGVIDVCPPKPKCEGNVILTGQQESLKITASKYRANVKRKRRAIQQTHFGIAKVEGSCSWKAWSAKRGGSFHLLDLSANLENGFSDPGFIIRAIELLESSEN